MKTFIILLPLLCFVNGRNLQELNEEREGGNEGIDLMKSIKDTTNQMRHRRKSRQSFYDPYYYYDNRRDYVRHQDDMFNQIIKLLDEIAVNLKRPLSPPPQPQIIYVPYPYPVRQHVSCSQKKPTTPSSTVPSLPPRWPVMEDDNMNWGLVPGDTDEFNEGDGSRPVSFDPVEPSEPAPESPPVEHGSEQAGMDSTTRAPTTRLGFCEAAILICCNSGTGLDQLKCFSRYGCRKTFATGLSCKPEIIKKVLNEYEKAYAPKKQQ